VAKPSCDSAIRLDTNGYVVTCGKDASKFYVVTLDDQVFLQARCTDHWEPAWIRNDSNAHIISDPDEVAIYQVMLS
jgi:hypothetical protein